MNKKLDGFKIPEDYLDNFTHKLMAKISEESSRETKRDGFKVPEAYFDALYTNIETKINSPSPKVIQLNPFKKYYYAAAVAAVLLFFIGLNLNTTAEITFDDLAISDIESYFEDNDLDFSTYELAEMLPIDELEIKDIIDHQLNDENIIDYIDNSTDTFEELNFDPNE
ncbi:hypothetical protein [Cellulophaga sp. Hel_I_12]|uniref:hypothetical protein n=1 Tax=Cellulophaga sp. Hel_I_12 TaxID=1249972 RepID=UPI000648AD2D|nr:hypothetical protein [Cellulophaga sp. Hel_I_12]